MRCHRTIVQCVGQLQWLCQIRCHTLEVPYGTGTGVRIDTVG